MNLLFLIFLFIAGWSIYREVTERVVYLQQISLNCRMACLLLCGGPSDREPRCVGWTGFTHCQEGGKCSYLLYECFGWYDTLLLLILSPFLALPLLNCYYTTYHLKSQLGVLALEHFQNLQPQCLGSETAMNLLEAAGIRTGIIQQLNPYLITPPQDMEWRDAQPILYTPGRSVEQYGIYIETFTYALP